MLFKLRLNHGEAMLREILFGQTNMPIYKNALDAFAKRHRAIASNIANSETPGFVPRKVSFEDRLKRALGPFNPRMNQTDLKHIPVKSNPRIVRPFPYKEPDGNKTAGVNDVDIDKEMAQLATNQIHFLMTAQTAKGYFLKMRRAIR